MGRPDALGDIGKVLLEHLRSDTTTPGTTPGPMPGTTPGSTPGPTTGPTP
jgi:hypothetical protein